MPPQTAITVGSFDGVHLGHAALLEAARSAVGSRADGGRVTALAFFPHPMTTLRPEHAPPRLTNWEQRRELLLGAGADDAQRLAPTPEVLSLEPREFVERVVAEHSPTVWVEGPDFRFGKARRGDVDTLQKLGREFGFQGIVVPEREVILNDLTMAPASSSFVRWLLSRGRLADARCVLGRPYEVRGVVEQGDQRGREIGFATANIAVESMPPADGVYAGLATLPDGAVWPAAISVGSKPTFGDRPRAVEAHLIGWDGALGGAAAGYGWRIALTFISWLREQVRYDDLPSLIAQIERDVDRTREMVGRLGVDAAIDCPA